MNLEAQDVQRSLGRIEGTLSSMAKAEDERHASLDVVIFEVKSDVKAVKNDVSDMKAWKIKTVAYVTGFVSAGIFFGQVAAAAIKLIWQK